MISQKILSTNKILDEISYNRNSDLLHSFMEAVIKYGQFGLAFSYSIKKVSTVAGTNCYFISSSRLSKIIYSIFYFTLCLYLAGQIVGERLRVTKYPIINWIKRVTHTLFVVQLIANRYCFECESKKKLLLKMFACADKIEEKFSNMGIRTASSFTVKRLSFCICGITLLFSMNHMLLVTTLHAIPHWSHKISKQFIRGITFNFVDFDCDTANVTLVYTYAYIGIFVEFLCWNLWYFCDCIRICTVLIMWSIFRRLNTALESGNLLHKDLPQVVDIHLKATNLMTMINKWISPITFFSTLHTLVYTFFWANYTLQDFHFRGYHIICIVFLSRNIFIFLMAADVNTKAHRISDWLEQGCSENERMPIMDQTKITVFVAQIYNRDSIGFKGLNFFTITSTFISGVIGLIITYTVIVTEFMLDGSIAQEETSHVHVY